MRCQTIKQGTECFFMTKQGCNFNGGVCHAAVESCQGCSKTITTPHGVYCQSFPDPQAKWRNGPCNLASHVKREGEKVIKINPLKASKRANKK